MPIVVKSLSEQISDRSVVVNGHVQIGRSDADVGVTSGVAYFGNDLPPANA
jgi:hypothetical protein